MYVICLEVRLNGDRVYFLFNLLLIFVLILVIWLFAGSNHCSYCSLSLYLLLCSPESLFLAQQPNWWFVQLVSLSRLVYTSIYLVVVDYLYIDICAYSIFDFLFCWIFIKVKYIMKIAFSFYRMKHHKVSLMIMALANLQCCDPLILESRLNYCVYLY